MASFGVHARDERGDGPRDPFGKRDGRVVAGGQHEPVEQREHPHMAPGGQHPDLRAGGVDGGVADADERARRERANHKQRGHHLRERGGGEDGRWVYGPEHAPGVEIEEHPGVWWVMEGKQRRVARARGGTAGGASCAPGSSAVRAGARGADRECGRMTGPRAGPQRADCKHQGRGNKQDQEA